MASQRVPSPFIPRRDLRSPAPTACAAAGGKDVPVPQPLPPGVLELEPFEAPARPAPPVQDDESGDETGQQPASLQRASSHSGLPVLGDCAAAFCNPRASPGPSRYGEQAAPSFAELATRTD